jgi:nitrite reductase/ring-hydroxylating ferredoxin subunit
MAFLEENIDYDFPEIEKDGIIFAEVCDSDEIFEGKGRRIRFSDDEDHQVAVIRFKGELYCLDNICPHRHADRIHEGLINKHKETVMCPLHGWTYYLKNGENVNKLQGLKSLKTHKVFEESGKVYVEKPELNIPKWRR